jgi:hypothetical protein
MDFIFSAFESPLQASILWTCIYLFLARVFKIWSKDVQLHSIVHCFSASLASAWAFHRLSKGNEFGLDMYHIILGMEEPHKVALKHIAFHSCGYFAADTIDIFIDQAKWPVRKVYILHHLASLVGLWTIHFDSFVCLYGVWLLEIGGVVHHIKHASHIFKWVPPFSTAAEVLYHSIYTSSRVLLLINTSKAWFYVHESSTPVVDKVCFVVVTLLVVQNAVWWYKNARTSLANFTNADPAGKDKDK